MKLEQVSEIDRKCLMTTIEMLEKQKNNYSNILSSLESKVENISNQYYNSIEIPEEVIKSTAQINKDILKVNDIIDNIDTAINTIDISFNEFGQDS